MSVLVVLTEARQANAQVHWGYQFARALDAGLVVLHAVAADQAGDCVILPRRAPEGEAADPDLAAIRAAADRAEAVAAVIDETNPNRASLHPPLIELKRLRSPQLLLALERAITESEATLVVVERNWKSESEGTLEAQLFEHAIVDTVVLRCGGLGEGAEYTARRIVAPAGRGDHVTPALQLGARLARANCGSITAFYVEDPGALQPEAVGQRVLERNLARAGVTLGPHVETRVTLDADVEHGIGEFIVARKPDLVLIGAEERRRIRRLLFQTVPDSLFSGEDAVTLAIVRRAQPVEVRVLRTLGRWFFLRVPQMTRDNRIALYDRLQSGSRWGFDFAALIGLATSIAAMGLIQDSAAVVIGAMLVAPLMTPILGAGLALVSGNAVLARDATKAIGLGFLMALTIGVVVGLVSADLPVTHELLGRGGPKTQFMRSLDLGVAFVSGVAAAFAMSREHLLAALPGVAIAAALVPPIATVGIGLARLDASLAGNAARLFGINVVAIIFGASFVMFAVGTRRAKGRTFRWRAWVWAGLIAALLGLTFWPG